jgi:hypothetical protein
LGHLWGDLVPSARQLRRIGTSILDHLRLRFPRGAEAKQYNVLQRLSYLAILSIIFPLLILTGVTMSPGLDAAPVNIFRRLMQAFGDYLRSDLVPAGDHRAHVVPRTQQQHHHYVHDGKPEKKECAGEVNRAGRLTAAENSSQEWKRETSRRPAVS